METKIAPEILNIEAWLETILARTSKLPAILEISQAYAGVAQTSEEASFRELIRVVDSLPNLLGELPTDPSRKVATSVIERLNRLLDPKALGHEFGTWRNYHRANIDYIQSSIVIFHDLKFDSEIFLSKTPNLYEEIDKLRAKFASSDDISEPSKIVLRAQLDLLKKGVNRFQTSGVGAFRDSIFSIYGRITIQLEADKSISPAKKREIADDILRVWDIAQMGGDLLKLAGPAIAGYLAAPIIGS
jgi:hypothetical protein